MIIIEDSRRKIVEFGELSAGDTFIFNKVLYMCTDGDENAVRLDYGEVCSFDEKSKVESVTVKAVIIKDGERSEK